MQGPDGEVFHPAVVSDLFVCYVLGADEFSGTPVEHADLNIVATIRFPVVVIHLCAHCRHGILVCGGKSCDVFVTLTPPGPTIFPVEPIVRDDSGRCESGAELCAKA